MRRIAFLRTVVPAAAVAVWLAGCSSVKVNEPVNQPISGRAADVLSAGLHSQDSGEDVAVGLAFSGGGTRAAAFAFGVLTEIDRTTVNTRKGQQSLLDRVSFVSGVSGGSVAAAYFGLKKRAALADFREKFLIRDAEEGLSTSIDPVNLVKAFGGGGVNSPMTLARWLDANLFHGATFADLRKTRGPLIWINASDIYNRTPFIFGETAFVSLCSDLRSYPIADAVAASAAVPIVFTPMVIKAFPRHCTDQPPDWLLRARANPNTPPLLKSYAEGLYSYFDGTAKYVKLLDGGLVDNYGLSGFTIARLSAVKPYEPLTPEQAVQMRRAIMILVDAGLAPSGNWVQTLDGPSGAELVMAAADTAVQASVRASFTAFQGVITDWQRQLIAWRCGLSAAERRQYHAPPNWNCRDLRLYIDRIAFDQLGPARAKVLNAIDTRFKLPTEQVDELIAAGRDALLVNPAFHSFLEGAGGRVRPDLNRQPPRVPVAADSRPSAYAETQ
jgi:NTE family protein